MTVLLGRGVATVPHAARHVFFSGMVVPCSPVMRWPRVSFRQQVEHPNVVDRKYSSSGVFGSKYITCVISGGEDNEIGFKAYQATNNAMALARAEALAPSAVKRDEVCVRESDKDHYVPEVLYQHKNEYGVEVTSKADPGIPLDYLFVTLESGFKVSSPASASLAPIPPGGCFQAHGGGSSQRVSTRPLALYPGLQLDAFPPVCRPTRPPPRSPRTL